MTSPNRTALFPLAVLGAALSLPLAPARAQEDPVIERLVEQGLYWQSRGEWSKARTAWEKILLSDADHPEALRGQFFDALQNGDVDAARELVSAMRERRPGHPFVAQMNQALSEATGGESALDRARELVRRGEIEAALAQYRITFGGVEPNGELALEYYTTLGGAPGEWQNAADGLQRLVAANPDEPRYALAYAKQLTYDQQWRRDGIERLSALADTRVAKAALDARRQALLWLDRTHADIPLYEAYLALNPGDEEVAALLRQTRRARTPGQERLVGSAFAALEGDDLDGAATSFSQLLRARPNDADALAGLGIVQLKRRDYAAAAANLEKALANSTRSRGDWRDAYDTARYWLAIESATAAMRGGELDLAGEQIERALAIEPTEEIGLLLKAELLHGRKDMAGAERFYRSVLEQNPDNVVALRGLGQLFNELDRFDEAERLARRSRELDADGSESLAADILAESLLARSRDYFDKGDIDQAEFALEEAMSARADSPWVRLELARLLLHRGSAERARRLMADLLESAPESSEVLHANAEFAYEDGRHFDGIGLLERVAPDERTPAMATLQNRLWIQLQVRRAIALARTDRFAKARATLADAEQVALGKPEMSGPLATGWIELGDDERALSLIRSVLRRSPDVGLQMQYAGLLLRTGRDEELARVIAELGARRDLNRFERDEVEHIEVSFALRRADELLRDGDFAAAYVRIEPYLRADKERPEVRMMLGRLYDASEDREAALSHYRAILRDEPRHLDARRAATGVLIDFGDIDAAEQLVAEGLGYHPEDPRMHLLAGRLAAARGQSGRSLASFEKALALIDDTGRAMPRNAPRAGEGLRTVALRPGSGDGFAVPGDDAASEVPLSLLAARQEGSAIELGEIIGLREEILTEIGQTRSRRSARVRIGGPFRNRSGEDGFGRVTSFGVPLRADIGFGDTGRLGLEAEAVTIDAGDLQRDDSVSRRYGALALDTSDTDGEVFELGEDGFAGRLTYDSRHFGGSVGTTPAGFPVSNVVGSAYVTNAAERLRFTARASREALDDSLLSYAGQTDPFLGVTWGGVTRTGARLDVELDRGDSGVYARLGSYQLEGENVASNAMTELGAGIYWDLADEPDRRLRLGLDVDTFGYEENLSQHTFGHGGYFSPQSYLNIGVPLTWSGRNGAFDFSLRGKVGFETFESDASDYFPTDAALQRQLETLAADDEELSARHEGESRSGLAFGVGGGVSYRLSPQLRLGSSFSLQNSGEFSESRVGAYTTYYFSPQYERSTRDPFGDPR